MIKNCVKIIFDKVEINDEVKELFIDFLDREKAKKNPAFTRGFIRCFLSNRIPISKNDFSDETFYKDIKICKDDYIINFPNYKKRKSTAHEKALFKEFYIYLLENNYGHFNVINKNCISYNNLYKTVLRDYKFINYYTFQDIPNEDKWILIDDEVFLTFDFSFYPDFKKIAMKNYIWSGANPSLRTKQGRQKYRE